MIRKNWENNGFDKYGRSGWTKRLMRRTLSRRCAGASESYADETKVGKCSDPLTDPWIDMLIRNRLEM